MTDLFWPGTARAGCLMSDQALLESLVRVEAGWLGSLVDLGVAPASARLPTTELAGPDDLDALGRGSEAEGNPVPGLVRLMRDRLGDSDASHWLHRGLTSQDVLDTALMLTLRDVYDEVERQLRRQVEVLVDLVESHRDTPMIGRTLTQHAVGITFGLKAAGWLTGVLDASHRIASARSALAVQIGGAAGTLAAVTELARARGHQTPAETARQLAQATALRLGLPVRMPWHTSRSPVTTIGDALVGCTDAWGHLAADVATLSRPEIGELSEGRGGGSSTMPGKHNPVLAVLVRRAALAAPPLGATLHLAAATAVDERPDGAWHVEWAALRDLGRRTVVAGSQTAELLGGLQVHVDRMRATLDAAGPPSEQESMAELTGQQASGPYLGATQLMIDAVLTRARTERSAPPTGQPPGKRLDGPGQEDES